MANPRNPNSWNSASSRGPSHDRRRQPSQSNDSGTCAWSFTSFRLNSSAPSATAFLNDSFSFGPPSSSAWAMMLSSVPYCCSHLAAVFGPHPGTPGTLSTESPTIAWKSTTWCGSTPQSAFSPMASSVAPLRRLTIVTQSASSCRQSLSLVHRRTFSPRAAPSAARVAITSSASYPGMPRNGIRIASITCQIIGSWTSRSGGGGSRWPL